jgi:hypothetical protein
MWSWLGRVWNWAFGNIDSTIAGFIHDLIHGIWGWLSSIFGHVGDAWHGIWVAANWGWQQLQHYGLESLAMFWHILKVLFPGLILWASRQFHVIAQALTKLWDSLAKWVANLIKRIEMAAKAVVSWVIAHVWTPLKNDFLQAWKWITTHGALVFYYISHPDKLVLLIADALLAWLEREAWSIGDKLGKFFVALIVHNLKRFVLLIEDILMAVF